MKVDLNEAFFEERCQSRRFNEMQVFHARLRNSAIAAASAFGLSP
jgi:hypothetical protein